MRRIAESYVLAPHEVRWRITAADMQCSALSDRAVKNRTAGPSPIVVAQTWFLAREIAAVFLGLNIDAVAVEADDRPLLIKTTFDRDRLAVKIGRRQAAQAIVLIRRIDGELVASQRGFFDAEIEPYDDEQLHPYRVTAFKRSKRKARR